MKNLAAALALSVVLPANLNAAPARAGGPQVHLPTAVRIALPGRLAGAVVLPTSEPPGTADLALVVADDPMEAEAGGEVRRRLYRYRLASRSYVPWETEPIPAGALELVARAAASPWLAVSRFGTLEVLPAPGEPPALRSPLPRRATRAPWGLRLTSPGARPLVSDAASTGITGEPPCFATEPEAHGRRLRVLLLCPGREPEETWALLPGPETVTASRFGLLAGSPALAVLTRTELGLFAKQDLRVFALAGSRNRLGTGPIHAAATDCPIWRRLELAFADADGDGLEDLTLVCEKGVIDPELHVELHRQRAAAKPGGTFERARVTVLEGEYDAWSYTGDWTGDGRADLVTLVDGTVALRSGSDGRRPVESRPHWSVRLPARGGAGGEDEASVSVEVGGTGGAEIQSWARGPRFVATHDLDGDGSAEIVLHSPGGRGGELFILRR